MKNPILFRSHSNAARPVRNTVAKTVALAGSVAFFLASIPHASAQVFTAGNLVVSRSVYTGTASTVTIGQALPGGGTAVVNGSYPGVWANEAPDPSFGVTSPIFLDEITTSGTLITSLPLASTAVGTAVNTSFSSKSEIALNLSTDGNYLTFMGYVSPQNELDVSNSNTPNHVDSTNPVAASAQRAIVQIDANGNASYTPVDSYSGNNGRAAILASGNYYTVGNAGNGSGTEPTNIVNNTGVQLATPGGSAETTVIGAQQGTIGASKGFQYGYSVALNGDPIDKSGKDNNFRGETVFNNTLYVTKGSGSNGINTVYQVGTAGTLPTVATASTTAISILPGFSTTLASASSGVTFPFGLWFANATTLYVTDEGADNPTFNGSGVITNPGTTGGLQKWSLVSGTWILDYELTAGLNLGTQYTVSGYTGPSPATDGLRNLTGVVNGDGTVTLFAVTSTESQNTDQGADPNQVVKITDNLSFTTAAAASGESFATIDNAQNGEVLRGVSFAPAAVPPSAIPALPTWALAGLTFIVFAAGVFYIKQKQSRRIA
jgi:hypothetical protein